MNTQELVAAIRADEVVGRGSCSVIDEAVTDDELIALLGLDRKRSPKAAVYAARTHHNMWESVAKDIRNA